MKHRFKGETCSLTSRNSDADDEEEADFGDKNGDDFFSSNSLPLTPFKNQVKFISTISALRQFTNEIQIQITNNLGWRTCFLPSLL